MSLLPLALVTAMAFTAPNGLIVLPTGADSFSVPFRGKSELTAFWCAAGAYVLHDLRKPASTRIFRASPPPRRSGQGVDFSLTPIPDAKTGLVLLGPDDGSITAALAESLCDSTR